MINANRTSSVDVAGTSSDARRFDSPKLLAWYEQMQLLRQFELALREEYRAGNVPGFLHLYLGQEAVAVGVSEFLRPDDWITSTHRGHGHALAKGVDPDAIMAELFGKATGCCCGRGGSMHLYEPDKGLFGTNGFVGGGLPATVGLALANRNKGGDQVAVAFFGDGAANHGTFHESLNLAAVQDAPAVFVCENNLYATATRLTQSTRNIDIASRAAVYGMPGISVDGNDVAAVADVAEQAIGRARRGEGPTLIEARTYRMGGHHEGDPATYREQTEVEQWKARCPLVLLREHILQEGLGSEAELDTIVQRVADRVNQSLDFARKSPLPTSESAHDHVWATPVDAEPLADTPSTKTLGWLDAVRDGLAEEMRSNPNVLYLGEGIGARGGSFAHTKGLYEEFGERRVMDTPISELGFTGAAIGAAAAGCPAVADLMFADFIFEAASQIIQQAAKLHYMSNGRIHVPMIVRAGMGYIKNAGPHHSGCYYPVWAHCAGLFVAVPSTPADAKGLMKAALRGGSPVILLEHKRLFSSKGDVPEGEHVVPFGRGRIAREGTDLTICALGLMVHRALEAAEQLEQRGLSVEVIDLRTLVPLDVELVRQSLARTHRLLVVDEAFSMCGVGAEIAASVNEVAFDELDAPIGRISTAPAAHPFSPPLEDEVVVTVDKIIAAAEAVVAGRPALPYRAPSGGERSGSHSTPRPAASSAANNGSPSATEPSSSKNASSKLKAGQTALIMPNQDLTVSEATVRRWFKAVGDRVTAGEEVVEVETDKAVNPVESPVDGVLVQIDAAPETVVQMGERLGVIDTAAR